MQPLRREKEESPASRLLRLTAERAIRYVDDVGARAVAPAAADLAGLAGFYQPFPFVPCAAAEVIRQLDELGSPATVATTGGRYFGFVNGGMVPAAVAANWMAAAWNQNAALRVMSPVAAELEEVALRWICEALELPLDWAGGLVTCATMANFTALVTARHALLKREGWDVTEDGVFGAPPIEVVVGGDWEGTASPLWKRTVKGGCARIDCHDWPSERSSASRQGTSTPELSTRRRKSAVPPMRKAPGCT